MTRRNGPGEETGAGERQRRRGRKRARIDSSEVVIGSALSVETPSVVLALGRRYPPAGPPKKVAKWRQT